MRRRDVSAILMKVLYMQRLKIVLERLPGLVLSCVELGEVGNCFGCCDLEEAGSEISGCSY